MNDYFTQVSENKLLDVPGLQPLRKDLLESAPDRIAFLHKPFTPAMLAETVARLSRVSPQADAD